MKVSLNWLKEYLDLPQPPQEIAESLTLAGLETEGIEEVEGDIIFEIGLTPNLGHCMSILGIVRELSAILQIPIKSKEVVLEEAGPAISVKVKIEDRKNCDLYACREVSNVTVGPSPDWLAGKLASAGIRSVNTVVDVGNLVMLECGQPLHLFDRDQLGKEIVVRSAKQDGKMQTLDGIEREIPDGVLLICDEKRPVAFAGVMGELSSSITEKTQNVLIEAALFAPEAVRKTSKQLNLRTDSSLRFERGIDPLGVYGALELAASLLEGISAAGTAKDVAKKYSPVLLDFDPLFVNRILGVDLSVREMCLLLGRLQIEVVSESEKSVQVAIPSYRNDIRSEIDIVEEVGRMYGFNHIPRDLPRHVSSMITHAPLYLFEEEVRMKCVALGLQECLTCDLIGPKLAQITEEKALDTENQIHVLYPASIDQSILRPSLLPGLLEMTKFNLDRQNTDLSAFEVGHIHFKKDDNFFQTPSIGILLTGKCAPYHFEEKPGDVDFFTLKGYVENLLSSLGLEKAEFEPSHLQNFHPGRQAKIKLGNELAGTLGEIHPAHLREVAIGQRVFYAELNVQDLMQQKKEVFRVEKFSLFPGSQRDWTVSLMEKTPIGPILNAINAFHCEILENVFLLDLYKSDKIGKDRKNATFRFTYRDPNKTIAYEEVEKEHGKITEYLAEKFAV